MDEMAKTRLSEWMPFGFVCCDQLISSPKDPNHPSNLRPPDESLCPFDKRCPTCHLFDYSAPSDQVDEVSGEDFFLNDTRMDPVRIARARFNTPGRNRSTDRLRAHRELGREASMPLKDSVL